MEIKLLNGSDYANIYGLYNENGVLIATEETKVAGWEAGKRRYYPLGAWNVNEVRRLFKEVRAAQEGGTK